MKMKRLGIWIIISIMVGVLLPEAVWAIPAFARRYKMSCTTCHAPIPRLKEFGEEFAGNGFVIPEEEKKRDYIQKGDDLLWLNRTFPIGARMDAYALYTPDSDIKSDMETPWGLKLLSGGALAKNIGYYFYFYMSERGEVAGIEDAYIHFNNLFGKELDVMVGQFQTSDPLLKRELRMTFQDYLIYKNKVGESNINLTYDRGIMVVYSLPRTGTDLTGFIVNGNGKGESGTDHIFDDDSFKNFGFRVMQGVGKYVSVGGFYYRGKEKLLDFSIPNVRVEKLAKPPENEVTYWGPDIHLALPHLAISGQYLYRKDTTPFGVSDNEAETDAFVAEAIYYPGDENSRLFFTALYNQVETNVKTVPKYQTATINASYLLARNLKLMAEYTRDIENETNNFLVGFVSGF
ncbi:MAG: hypothetical protein Kow0037_10870 [Calditrichia bacterium]